MNGHPRDHELQELVSGTLTAPDASRIEEHLSGCARCSDEVRAIRMLVASLADLPAEIRPDRDLRPGIWRSIDAAPEPVRAVPGRRAWWRLVARSRWPLAAAALALIAVTAVLSVAIDRRVGRSGAPGAADAAALDATQARVNAAASELEALLAEQLELLSPATRQVLETSLSAIDAAVAEARAALAGDPGNPMLSHMLMAAYEKKLGVLRAAAQAPVGI